MRAIVGGITYTNATLSFICLLLLYLLFCSKDKTPIQFAMFSSGKDSHQTDCIKTHMIEPSRQKPVLQDKTGRRDFSQIGQSKFVDRLLGERRNGFFVECGAASGEYLSNSLFFELERNWTGLLVEANPMFYKELFTKRRNAYILPTCLSPTTEITPLTFQMADVYGGLKNRTGPTHAHHLKGVAEITLTCVPLMTILSTIRVKHIDFLSLDVEGAELDILKTIDFDEITIDVIAVEYNSAPKILNELRLFINSTGRYDERVMLLPEGSNYKTGQDVVFKMKSV